MKVAIVYHDKEGGIGRVRVATDSTLLRMTDPLFVADHIGEWTGTVCPAVRMSRLGTNIPLRASGRYFDSATLALTVDSVSSGAIPDGAISLLDRSVVPGEWIASEFLTDTPCDIGIRHGSTEESFFRTEGLRSRFEADVHNLSRYCTFKTGDILILGDAVPCTFALHPEEKVLAGIGGKKLLQVKLK